MKTLKLDWNTWDVELDESGNLGVFDTNNSVEEKLKYVAQTVANAVRLFKNDAYFFKDEGIPHFEEILGFEPPPSLVQEHLKNAALSVPLVKSVDIIEYLWKDRTVSGIIRVFTISGEQTDVRF